jgi:hypothetical protein
LGWNISLRIIRRLLLYILFLVWYPRRFLLSEGAEGGRGGGEDDGGDFE